MLRITEVSRGLSPESRGEPATEWGRTGQVDGNQGSQRVSSGLLQYFGGASEVPEPRAFLPENPLSGSDRLKAEITVPFSHL